MYSGSVVESSDVSSLFREAKHPYSRALLEAVPRIRDTRSIFRPIPGSIPALTNPPDGCRFHPRCSQALEQCSRIAPPATVTGPDHAVACHLYPGQPG
jgi:oligopeptide/dipeptide ABC transporter ATP-binding protein